MIKKRKVNSYDILFLVMILAVVFVIVMNVSADRTAPINESANITFKIYGANRSMLLGIEKTSDFLIEDKFAARLVEYSSEPSRGVVLSEWGEYKSVHSSERVDITLTLTADCIHTEMGYLLDGLKYAVPNMTLTLRNDYILTDAKILRIEKILQ